VSHLQLLEGTRSERIRTHHTRFEPRTGVVQRVLGDGGRLAGTLQTNEHDHARLALLRHVRLLARIHHVHQLLVHCSLDKLLTVHARWQLRDVALGLNVLAELNRQAHPHIGLQQRVAHLLQQLLDVLLLDDCGLTDAA
jgi:hypothetical protein